MADLVLSLLVIFIPAFDDKRQDHGVDRKSRVRRSDSYLFMHLGRHAN
jgi:hypothetical protein